MSVSKQYIFAGALLSLVGGAALADNCCGSGSFTGGITNIPVVSGGSNCCGTATSQIVGVPGIYVPSNAVGVNVGGTTIGSSNYNVGGTIVGGNNVVVGGNTYLNSSSSYYGGGASSGGVAYYGGGGSTYLAPAPTYSGMIDGLNVGGAQAAMEQVSETKTVTEIVPIRAVCMDDKGMPHPASRVSDEDQVKPEFNGEVYRCMAGTHMEITMGRMVDGKPVFDGGRALSCQKGQALSYAGGNITCVAQKPAGNCNERSLLRRFGPGVKFLTLTRTMTSTKQVQSQQSQYTTFRSSMFVDGGVGQGVY